MANLYDKASLVLPTSPAYKDGAIQAYKPLTSQGTFDFSRGTNLAATRVNADGLIEKGRENVLLNSNQFNSTWASYAVTETGGQIGYDGTSNAWLLDKSAASGNVYQDVSISGVNTYSVYVKGGTNTWVALLVAGPNAGKFFNLSGSGAVGSNFVNAPVGASIESIGSGWFRISIITNASVTQVRIYPAEGDGVNSGTSGNILIQDAQVEQGLVATDYIETGTSAAQSGILEDMPRLDYSGDDCPSLLLEPSRTNGNSHSEYFSGSGFGIVAATQTPNQAISPEGVRNATSLIGTASTAEHIIYTTGSSTYNGNVTVSIFAKANGYDYFVLGAGAQGQNKPVLFNIANGTKVGNFTGWSSYGAPIDSDIEDYGNGWYRVWVTFAATSGANTNMFFGSMPTDSVANAANISTQNGTDGSYVYGAFIESGSYPTSYIPTYGTSTTRGADSASKTGISSLIGQTEGTLFIELDNVDDIDKPEVTLDDGTNSNRILLSKALTTGFWTLFTASSGTAGATDSSVSTNNGKFAIAYNSTNYVVYKDGVEIITRTAALPVSLSAIRLNGRATNDLYGNKSIKQALLFKTRLSNAELEALTTL